MAQVKPTARDISDAVGHVLNGHKTCVVFFAVNTRVRATLHGKRSPRNRTQQIFVSVGRPNFNERKFLSLCRRAGVKPRRIWFPKG